MVDYFKPSIATLSAHNMSGVTTADDRTQHDQKSNMVASEMETQSKQEIRMKAELDAKLEQDILDNVGVNFIFNKGTGLAKGLID